MKLLRKFAATLATVALLLQVTPVFAASHEWFTTDASTAWRAVASDADGSNLIAGNSTNSIFISHDFGGIWAEHLVGPSGNGARSVKSDSTGTNLLVGGGASGLLYRSEDSGETWSALDPSSGAVEYWTGIASDADGSNLAAVTSATSTIYTSFDGGDTWEEHTATSTQINIISVDSDADGSVLIIGTFNGFIYVSDDGGDTWVERRPAGDTEKNWDKVASDADGSNLIVAGGNTLVYTSSDGGANWMERQPTGFPTEGWGSVASDDTGTNLLAGVNGGSLHSSDDGGDTWFEEQPGGVNSYAWQAVASDADGSNLIVATVEGGLYVTPEPIVLDSFTPSDNAREVVVGTNLTLVFNKDIATTTGNITIHKASDDSLVETVDVAGPKATLSDTTTLEIDLDADLEEATEYYVLIDTGAIEDDGGAPFVGISDETQWSFTTDAPPVVETFSPADDAEDVSITVFSGGTPTIVFDQDVVVGTGNITLKKVSDDSTVATFDVTDADALEAEDENVYIYQDVDLEYATAYYLLIDEGAFVDGTGNSYVGIADETTWNFTVQDVPAPPALDFERVNVNNEGEEGDSTGFNVSLSTDGRYVVFSSGATNLVSDDTNGWDDVFVYDRDLDTIERVSVSDLGEEGDSNSQTPSISSDGRYVAFRSATTNLIPDDTNDTFDVFVYDRDTDTVERVSLNDLGQEGDGASYDPILSNDGRYVAFYSDATNLVTDDTNSRSDAFVYDRDTDTIERVSLDDEGGENTENVQGAVRISGNGNFVTFSTSGLLVPEAIEGYNHLYVYDRDADTVEMVDKNDLDEEGNSDIAGGGVAISADGRYVAFSSNADNLVSDDTEGVQDVFVLDRETGVMERITNDDADSSYAPVISADGRYVAFGQTTDDGEGDYAGVYRYDRTTDTLLYITEGSSNSDGSGYSDSPAISNDGLIIGFVSDATNLVTGDTNSSTDVFVWEEVVEEETPPADDEEEEDGGGSSSHRRGGGSGTTGGSSDLLTLLRTLITQFIAQGGTPSPAMLAFLGTPTTTSNLYTRDLDLGAQGDDVLQLQLFLMTQNKGPAAQSLASNGATGFFGPLTQAALAEYQAPVGITPAVGFFGPVTRAYVNSL
ncbi:MAG: hypothetical protein RLY47_356 [Candidatus Parcubacteria bacterium]|jgi:photosystem II stability/assembly factor-like uncharacterized protein